MKTSLNLQVGDKLQWHSTNKVLLTGVFLEYADINQTKAIMIVHSINKAIASLETTVDVKLLSCINS
jgi:hypothetical protein